MHPALVVFPGNGDVPATEGRHLATRRPDLPAPMVESGPRGLSAAPDGRFDSVTAFTQALSRRRVLGRAFSMSPASLTALVVMAGLVVWANNPNLIDRFMPRLGALGCVDAERLQALALQERTRL